MNGRRWLARLRSVVLVVAGAVFGLVISGGVVFAQWTAPKTWTAGELVSPSAMNTHIRDNLTVLRAGGIAIASQAANDLIYASSATQFARLATGTGVLTAAAGAPSWSSTPTLTGTNISGITEANIVDGAILARVGANEAISGAWTFNNGVVLNGQLVITPGGSTGAFSLKNNGGTTGLELLIQSLAGKSTYLILSESGVLDKWAFGSDAGAGGELKWRVTNSAGGVRMQLTPAGELTAPLQPGFLAVNTTSEAAEASGATVDLETEIYDDGGDFFNDVFTAPVTGRYHLCGHMTAFPSTNNLWGLLLVTSNRTYRLDVDTQATEGQREGCVYADMDAADTASLQIITGSGTLGVYGTDVGGGVPTYFSGRLVP